MKSAVDVDDAAVQQMVEESVEHAFDDLAVRRWVEAKLKAQYSAGIKPLAGNLPTGSNSGVGGTFGAGTTAPAAGGAQQIINIQAITNATAADIAHEVSWTMRTAPV